MSSSNYIEPDDTIIDGVTGEILPPNPSTDQIAVLAKAEIDQQIATAKAYPRSEDKSLKKAESLACRDEDTASSMFYSIPRGNKHIQGPSVRLAEIMASTWGNLRIQTRVIDANDKFVTVQAVAHDLENNTAVMVEKRRRVLAKKGRAVDDDSIQIAGLAGQSIVFRDAIFKVVPRVYIDQIYRKAQLTSVGKAESIVSKRTSMLAYFAKMGVSQERILAAVGANGIEDIDMDNLIILKGLATAIKDGQVSVDDAFPDPSKPKEGTAAVAEALKKKTGETESKSSTPVKETESTQTEQPKEPQQEASNPITPALPEWAQTWMNRIDIMHKFSPAASELDALLKEYRSAEEDKKIIYYGLFAAWLAKTIPFADKPSLVPLLHQKIDQLKPHVPEAVYESLKATIAEAKK